MATVPQSVIPSEYRMPDLSTLRPLRTLNVVRIFFAGNPPDVDRVATSLRVTFVRLLDKALIEYEAARGALAEFALVHRLGDWRSLMMAVDHLEDSITATHRALSYAEALRRRKGERPIAAEEMPRPFLQRQLRDMRNKIEHIDADLLRGRVPENAAIQLFPHEEFVELDHLRLAYGDLAGVIERLHSLAVRLDQ
jgi:hypothetical protein